MYPVHYVPAGDVLPVFFSTYGKTNGESLTMSGLAVTDIEIYKDGSTTQRASDAGYTLLDTDGIDFDSITGIHGFSIDTGDNTDASFYTVGAWFHVVVSAVTVDSQTVNFIACAFRIMPAESVAGKPKVDTDTFGGSAGTFSSGRPEVNTTHAAGTAWGSGAITAAAFAANAINAAKLDPDVATELQSGLATAAELAKVPKSDGTATWNATALASLQQEATDALNAYDPPTRAELTSDVNTLAAAVDAVDNFVDTELAAVKTVVDAIQAKTDNLPSDPADASVVAGLIAAAEAKIDIIDDFLDTEIAAILTDTSTTIDDLVDDLEARLTQALADKLAAHALSILTLVVDAGSTTTAVVFKTVNGAAASAVDDFYNGAVIVFTSGALLGQRTSISDYVGATKTATVVALTGAPADTVTGVIV